MPYGNSRFTELNIKKHSVLKPKIIKLVPQINSYLDTSSFLKNWLKMLIPNTQP